MSDALMATSPIVPAFLATTGMTDPIYGDRVGLARAHGLDPADGALPGLAAVHAELDRFVGAALGMALGNLTPQECETIEAVVWAAAERGMPTQPVASNDSSPTWWELRADARLALADLLVARIETRDRRTASAAALVLGAMRIGALGVLRSQLRHAAFVAQALRHRIDAEVAVLLRDVVRVGFVLGPAASRVTTLRGVAARLRACLDRLGRAELVPPPTHVLNASRKKSTPAVRSREELPDFLTLEEASATLRLGRSAMYDLLADGASGLKKITRVIGRRRVFPRTALFGWAARYRPEGR